MVTTNNTLTVTGAPAIPRLTFRGFRGQADYPAMVQVIEESKQVDQIERTESVKDIARNYEHLVNCDPYRDMLFAEMHGQVIGYSRVWWNQELDGTRTYQHFVFLTPEWRGQGVRRAMLRYNERRLREIAGDHPADGPRFFESWVADTEAEWEALLVAEGYQAVRYALRMVRPNLEDIPDLPLPEGLQVRPVPPEHYRTVWKAAEEAFRDAWGASEWRDEYYEDWISSPTFMPGLWQVAWDGEQVAGMVLNQINEAENDEYNRKRGYTQVICVRRPWRKRGLARALIARSFRVLKEQGITEAALGLDAQNLHGALRLYESMGFRVVKRFTTFRKEVDPPSASGQA